MENLRKKKDQGQYLFNPCVGSNSSIDLTFPIEYSFCRLRFGWKDLPDSLLATLLEGLSSSLSSAYLPVCVWLSVWLTVHQALPAIWLSDHLTDYNWLTVFPSHIIEWPTSLTCFLSLNLAPSRCTMYLLSTWYPACRTCASREDNEAIEKPKQPRSTNFRQSTWKSSNQRKTWLFILQSSNCYLNIFLGLYNRPFA